MLLGHRHKGPQLMDFCRPATAEPEVCVFSSATADCESVCKNVSGTPNGQPRPLLKFPTGWSQAPESAHDSTTESRNVCKSAPWGRALNHRTTHTPSVFNFLRWLTRLINTTTAQNQSKVNHSWSWATPTHWFSDSLIHWFTDSLKQNLKQYQCLNVK